MIDNLVIGSGPSGLAASIQLLDQGESVMMLDGGVKLESSIQAIVTNLASKDFSHWDRKFESDYASLGKSDPRFKSHIGSKLKFGSNFCYANSEQLSTESSRVNLGINAYPSLAIGGLSNVWGSICFPFTLNDRAKLRYELTSEHYRIVDHIMPQAGLKNEFEGVYDIYSNLQPLIEHSNLSKSLVKKFSKSNWFGRNGYSGGRPRIAVATEGEKKCQSCGFCATGCVWESIWSSTTRLDELRLDSNFIYSDAGPAVRIKQGDDHLTVICKDTTEIQARRIFLACGSISTAILLSRSNLIECDVTLDETQLTLIPCVSLYKKQSTRNFVLSQFILRRQDSDGLTKEFIQITGYNHDLVRRVQTIVPLSKFMPKNLLNFILKFVATAMIFQDSESSGKIRITTEGNSTQLTADSSELIPILKTRRRFRVFRALLRLRLLPLPFLAQQVGVGESYHFGNLKNLKGARLIGEDGKLTGCVNLYIVDGSSLDYIAPGPVTYSTMANAVRIVREASS